MSMHRFSVLIHRRLCAALGVALLASGSMAQATPPQASQQVPGYYRAQFGAIQVTALFDGAIALSPKMLIHFDPATAAALNQRSFVPSSADGLQTAVTGFLIHDGKNLTLIDAGTAACFGPGLGQIPNQLRAAGYRPEDVSTVLLTHAHPDHLCGVLNADGSMTYPKATVWLAQEDADYWLNPESEKTATDFFKPLFGMARNAVAPYQKARQFRRFSTKDTLPNGIQLLPSHGHTPGHSSFLIDAGSGGKLLVWGDIVHYHAVQFAHPEASFEPDSDHQAAVVSRRKLMQQAAAAGWWVAGAHLPFPGLGHIRSEGDAYAWVPTEYSPLPAP
jgi:glyoxylase-like metal-dependent hydrolase (beta-lactamase superfamily II)